MWPSSPFLPLPFTVMSEVQAEEWTTLVLKPVLLLAFGLLHVVYHFGLMCSDAWSRVHQHRPASSSPEASWPQILEQYSLKEQDVKVPKHLAVVLIDSPPSPLRLALYSLLRGSRKAVTSHQQSRQNAVQFKHAHDIATLVHLSRLSGIQQLTVYTPQPLISVEPLQQILLDSFGTKTIVRESNTHREHSSKRRRGSSSSTTSSSNSSDTDASASSTLASSYTVDAHQHTVDICIGHSGYDTGRLRLVLLSGSDADNFSRLTSKYIAQSGQHYLSLIRLDVAAGNPSVNRLRTKWQSQRAAKVTDLTTDRLNEHLLQHGYMSEPELLIVYGGDVRCRQLHGIPAWAMRVTDLFFDAGMQPYLVYSWHDFVPALRKHASAQQRYGR